ncbi:MAG TPA: DUF58 domain-containing protein [Vicinamibacterales bacterium]|nr:DUF58 domain-containing protein [Vicinamibacterales bacterium]
MSRPHVVAPSELSALRDLELLARTTVEGLRQGLHRSPFHGFSAEFSQYRHYRPGDDLKYVDWKAFARTDRLYSRQFRETTNLGALFVVDVSRSMNFPETDSKFALARAAAAVLATLVVDQGDAAGIFAVANGGSGPGATHYVPPRSGRHHLHLCLAALARLQPQGDTSIATALKRAGGLLRRRGLIVIVSDLYEEDETIAEIRRLARMGHDVVTLHVMAKEELALTRGGATQFVDLETGHRLVASPDAIAAEYHSAVAAFLARVRKAIAAQGLDYVRLVTGDALEPVLRRYLVGRRGGA